MATVVIVEAAQSLSFHVHSIIKSSFIKRPECALSRFPFDALERILAYLNEDSRNDAAVANSIASALSLYSCSRLSLDEFERILAHINEVIRNDAAAANPISSGMDFSLWQKKRDPIGRGGFGTVYVGLNEKTRELCAIKEMYVEDLGTSQSLHQEIQILSQLAHRNIVKYYGSKREESQISIYMEYVQPGSLTKYIRSRGALQESLVRDFTAQILSGLVYLHRRGVVHRDIKPDNLLVDSQNNVKLADFGLAKSLDQSAGNHSVEGTIRYAAPEVIRKGAYKSSGEAYAADIWSLGCVVIQMLTGEHPWPNCTNKCQVMYKVCSKNEDPAIPENLSLAGKRFLKRCFMRDPAKRPSAAAFLNHPFVKSQSQSQKIQRRRCFMLL